MAYDKNKPSDLDVYFKQASDSEGVSYDYLRKLSFNESSFNVNAQSPTGPRGPMQMTKATARALGLVVSDDGSVDERTDPAKAIPAGARHLADLTRKFGGDELKAALAYNQGEGRLGSTQLKAYDSGDFGKISAEGLNYMRKLSDVAKSPQLDALTQYGGIRPKADAFTVEEATKSWGEVQPAVKAGVGLPEGHEMGIQGAEVPAPNKPFSEQFWDQHHETISEAEDKGLLFGTKASIEANTQNSPLGMAIRAARVDNSWDLFKDVITPTKWNSHVWTPEELSRIQKEVKNPAYMSVVTGGSPENLDALIKLANENADLDAKAANSGAGAKVIGGVLGASLDPLSYVPIAGNAYKGASLLKRAVSVGAQTAGLSVGSEFLRTNIAGGEAHYTEAAVGGFVFGAGLSSIADGLSKVATDNPFHGTVTRLQNREDARLSGGENPAVMPIQDGEQMLEHAGVPYAHAVNDGDVRLQDGTIISASNPVNPETMKRFAEVNPEKSAYGIKTAGMTELGLRLLSSEDTAIRGIAQDLVRSPVGMQSGSNGKFGATASDIVERLRSGDNRAENALYDAMKTALKDPEWSTGAFKTSAVGARQTIYQRAVEAIERPENIAKLTDNEKKVMTVIKDMMDAKYEMLTNPSMFGRNDAIPVLQKSRHVGTYVPNVYSRELKHGLIAKLGSPEEAQKAIASSWLKSYHTRPEVKARIDEHLAGTGETKVEVTPEMVEKYAMDKAYGISHSDQFHVSSNVDDQLAMSDQSLTGLENNQFLEARQLFDSDLKTTLPDGSEFSVNMLRDFDMRRIIPAYNRRVNGDIAIHGATGKTTKQLKDEILAMKQKADGTGIGANRQETDALADTLKILTGRGRRSPDGALGTMLRSMADLSFFAKNAYMGVQNLTEIAGMIANGNVRALANGVPYLGEMMNRTRVLPVKEVKELHSMMFGKEVDDLMRPTRQDLIEKLREFSPASQTTANIVGTIKFGTQELAAKSPWTKVLNGTTNYLIDAGRQGVLSDILDNAVKGRNSRWLKENYLKSASVSPEQAAGIKALIKEHVVRNADGSYTMPNKQAFSNDPRAMDLWRLGDKIADEVMLRPHKLSLQDSQAFGPFARLMLQFKSFTIKSLNSKFLRSFYEGSKNGRALDTALTWAISGGLAGTYYVAQAHLKAASLPKEQQSEYLKKALDPNMVSYAALSRGSYLGAPLGVFNLVAGPLGYDPAKMVRSSVLPQAEEKRPDRPVKGFAVGSDPIQNFMTGVLQQVPGAGWAANAFGTGYNLSGYLNSNKSLDERDYLTGMMNTSRELVPNDPITQQILLHMYQNGGIHLNGK